MRLWQVCGHVMKPQKSGELASVVVRVTTAVRKHQRAQGTCPRSQARRSTTVDHSAILCPSSKSAALPYFILSDLS